MLTSLQLFKFALVSCASLTLVACESSGSYRLASVGNVPDGSSGDGSAASGSGGDGSNGSPAGGTSSGGMTGGSGTGTASTGGGSSGSGTGAGSAGTLGSGVLVTAGNTVIGVAGKHQLIANKINGAAPAATPITATVTRVLTKTGQTLVNLGNGKSLILDKAGGKIGDVVKIDLGSNTVIGAPSGSPLIGVGVLSPGGSGNVANISSSALPADGTVASAVTGVANAVNGAASVVSGTVGTVSAVTTPAPGPVTTTVADTVANTVAATTAPVSVLTGGVTAGGSAGGSIATPITTITGGAGGSGSVATTVTNTTGTITNAAGGLTGRLTGALKKK